MKIINKYIEVDKNGQGNAGNFKYRTLDDIYKTLRDLGIAVDIKTDLIVCDVPYIKVTATDVATGKTCDGFALLDKRFAGSAEQLTGSATTYATKYAICSLYCISNGIDPDEREMTYKGKINNETASQSGAVRKTIDELEKELKEEKNGTNGTNGKS